MLGQGESYIAAKTVPKKIAPMVFPSVTDIGA